MQWCEEKQEKLFLLSNNLHRDGAINWDAAIKWIGVMGEPGVDPGFFKGGGWYPGVAESMGHAPKMLLLEN